MEIRRDGGHNRRQSERFPIERQVRYRLIDKRNQDERGEGQTINISSHGVAFRPPGPLTPGIRLQMCISWPVLLNDRCALKLVVRGRVARVSEDLVAVEIQQHEFRTNSV